MLLGSIGAISALVAILAALSWEGAGFWWIGVLLGSFAGCCLVLALLAFGFLMLVCALVDLEKPQTSDSKFYRQVMYIYIEALITLVRLRVHTQGLEKTPKEGRFLLVCNHLVEADPGVLLHYFKKSQLAFISKKENQSMFVVGRIMHKVMCQLIDREDDRKALRTILQCIQQIKEDQTSIAVFPEGYISDDGKLRHFRSGVFKIAQKTKVPIVVCTLRYEQDLFANIKQWKPTQAHLHLVDVIQPEEYQGLSTVELGEKVYEMMISDLGESFRAET